MKAKLVKVVIAVSVLMMVMVGCGQKEVSVTPTNIVEEKVEAEISDGVQENIDKKQENSASEFEFEEQDGEMVLVKYNGSASNISIPKEYEGKTVKSIDAGVFFNNKTLLEVELPETITQIGEEAFMMCTSLEKINIPENIQEIGIGAFNNTRIKEILVPTKLLELEKGVFSVTQIEKIIIPSNIKTINDRVFEGCENLQEVEIKEGVEIIEDEAFGDCTILEKVVIPASVTTINEYAFMYSGNNLVIIAPEGSYAQQYAAEQEITFQAQ